MSSATSTNAGVHVDADRSPGVTRTAPTTDAGFRPWHFFVLASLVAATGAVILSRQSTPEHLIALSLTIGAAGIAAAGFYRMLAPLAADDASAFREPLTERARNALEREKTLVLRSLKELEFDRAMGKVSSKDFDEMAGRLRARAFSLMKQLDEGGAGYRNEIERELGARLATKARTAQRTVVTAPPGTPRAQESGRVVCGACGTDNDTDAVFCKRCGSRMRAAGRRDDAE
jgi:hypothetical protein